jgi:uncharacterized membrane protein
MVLEWISIPLVNLLLCIVIVILGYLCYRKSGEMLPVFVGAAFGLFGISHAATLANLATTYEIPLILIRTLAYVIVIGALWLHMKNSLLQNEAREGWVEYFKSELGQSDKPKKE